MDTTGLTEAGVSPGVFDIPVSEIDVETEIFALQDRVKGQSLCIERLTEAFTELFLQVRKLRMELRG